MDSINQTLSVVSNLVGFFLIFLLCYAAYEQGSSSSIRPAQFWKTWFKYAAVVAILRLLIVAINYQAFPHHVPLIASLLSAVLIFPAISIVCLIPWVIGRIQRKVESK